MTGERAEEPAVRGRQRFRIALDEGWTLMAFGFVLLLLVTGGKAAMAELASTPTVPLSLLLDLARDLGIAFVVGATVSLGIERLSRARFQQQVAVEIKAIQKNVINAAYLRRYPNTYTSVIEELLLGGTYFRLNQVVDIDLFCDVAHPDRVSMEQTTTYRIRNIGSDKQDFRPAVFVDSDWDGEPPTLLSWKIGTRALTAEEIDIANASRAASSTVTWFLFPEATPLQPGEDIHVAIRSRTFKRLRDTTTWCGMLPADSLRFSVTHPAAFQAFISAKTPARGADTPVTSDGKRVFIDIFSPLLPYTTVEFGWRPDAPNGEPSLGEAIEPPVATG